MTDAAKQQYNEDHRRAIDEKLASARAILPLVRELVPVESVLDVGCGYGAFLAVWAELGVPTRVGVEGDWIAREALLVPPETVRVRNLEAPLDVEGRFDLVTCLEVAEHLSPQRARGFVADLVARAPAVLFSAAIPGQGGTGHVNEQWQDYWVRLFRAQGYEPVDAIRPRIWDDPEVCWWYAQNALLFADWRLIETTPALERAWSAAQGTPANLVHPRLYASLHATLAALARGAEPPPDPALFEGVAELTMESRARQELFVRQVEAALDRGVPGDIVECGVWSGGMMVLAARTLLARGETDRHLWLYDTFAGMTKPDDMDRRFDGSRAADIWEAARTGENSSDWCVAPIEAVRANLAATGYPMDRVHLVAGDVNDTAPRHPSPIAVLRIDVDWYAAIRACIDHLWPRAGAGALVTIADYSDWTGGRRAGDEFLAHLAGTALARTVDGMLVVEKPAAAPGTTVS